MFSKQQSNILRSLIVGNAVDTVSGLTAGTDKISSAAFATGEVVVTSESGTLLDAGTIANFQKVRFTQFRADGSTRSSDVVDLGTIKSVSCYPFRDVTQEQTVIGFDPTTSTGAIDVLNLNTYYLRVYDQADSRLGFASQNIIQSHMTSDANATQAEIAVKLVDILAANNERKADRKLLVEATGDLSTATTGAAPGSTIFTNGSNAATFAGTAAIGEYISVSNVIYQVKSVVSNVMILDRLFTGASATVVITNSFQVTSTSVPCGVRITGTPNSFRAGDEYFRVTRFKVGLQDFGDTPVREVSKGDPGIGRYEQVAELELWSEGNNFHYYRKDFQYRFTPSVVIGAEYSSLTIEYSETTQGGIGPRPVSPKALTLNFELTAGSRLADDAGTAGYNEAKLNAGGGTLAATKSGLALVDAINAIPNIASVLKTRSNGATILVGTDL